MKQTYMDAYSPLYTLNSHPKYTYHPRRSADSQPTVNDTNTKGKHLLNLMNMNQFESH